MYVLANAGMVYYVLRKKTNRVLDSYVRDAF